MMFICLLKKRFLHAPWILFRCCGGISFSFKSSCIWINKIVDFFLRFRSLDFFGIFWVLYYNRLHISFFECLVHDIWILLCGLFHYLSYPFAEYHLWGFLLLSQVIRNVNVDILVRADELIHAEQFE